MRTEELGTRTQRGTDPPRTASAQIHVSLAVPVPGTLGTLRSFFQLPRYLCISERSTAEEESITRTRSTCGPRSRREAASTASKAAAETRARQRRNAKAPPWSREPRDSDQGHQDIEGGIEGGSWRAARHDTRGLFASERRYLGQPGEWAAAAPAAG